MSTEDKENIPSANGEISQGEPKTIDIKLPTGETTPIGRKTRKKKEKDQPPMIKEADPILKQNITTIINVLNGLAAVRLGNFWRFSEQEIVAIADPAARICERAGFGEFAGKYSDFFMLGAAVLLPIGGRLLVLTSIKNQKEGGPQIVQPSEQSETDSEREVSANSKRNSRKTSGDGANVIDDRLPAIADPI